MPRPFPTTPILDDFNRADEDPIQSPWVILTGTPNCRIFSNTFRLSSGTFGQAYYSALEMSDLEFYVTFDYTSFGNFLVEFRMTGTSDANKVGYQITLDGTTITLEQRPAGGTGAVVLGTASQIVANGDKFGARALGPDLEVWYKAGAGAWTQKIVASDSTYTSGFVLLQLANTTSWYDDFGGGALNRAGVSWTGA